MALGEFTGGEVKYWPLDNDKKQPLNTLKPDQAIAVQAKHKVLLFDGRCGHEVNDFEGEIYSLVSSPLVTTHQCETTTKKS